MTDTKLYEGFTDLDANSNLERGLEYYAAGIITDYYDPTAPSGKHLAVSYINPWGEAVHAWRSVSEVRRQPMGPDDYAALEASIRART